MILKTGSLNPEAVANNSISLELKKRLLKRWRAEKAAKFHIEPSNHSSNLATPTEQNRVFDTENPVFNDPETIVADKIVRKPLRSRSGFLYRKARLVADQEPWYIVYYTTDAFNEKLIRKRIYKNELDPANFGSKSARLKFAKQACEEINQLLHDDWHTESPQPPPKILGFDFRHFTVIRAIDYVAEIKRDVDQVKPKTVKEYMATKSTMIDFMMHEKIGQDYLLRNVNDTFVRKYFDYLKQIRKSVNKTYNARRSVLHAVFAELIRRDPKLFHSINPIAHIKMLKTESKKHAAYTDEQVLRIREAILKKGQPQLLLFIQFMYYSLARPEEIRNLKVGDIKFSERKILFQSATAKTSIEQYVGINDTFAQIIEASGILQYPENDYVFSYNMRTKKVHPGPERMAVNYFYKNIKPIIRHLGFLKLNPNYTMYSFKHTGAIALYKATKDIKLVQSQCRHQSIEQTNIYLRDLGVMDDFEQLNKWKGPL